MAALTIPAELEEEAAIDTSSPYLVLTSEVAQAAGLDLTRPDARGKARIQGTLVEGSIYVTELSLLADEDEGVSMQQPVWAFVPDGAFDPEPLPPTLIGLKRCLDTFLFAVDPFRQMFYFGERRRANESINDEETEFDGTRQKVRRVQAV